MEYTINGKIISENGDGFKNLLVVFYDTDKKLNLPKILKKSIFEYLEDNGSERLGSTYSENNGSFTFGYNYKDFAPDNEEERPDIIVIVLTPEEKNKTLKDRILYFSNHPLLNGGQNEAIVIKLDVANDINIEPEYKPTPPMLYNYIKVTKEKEKQFSNKIAPLLIDSYKKKKKINEDSIFKNTYLTTLSKTILKNDNFIKDRKDKSVLSKKMKKMVEASYKKFELPSTTLSTYSLNLTKEDFKKLKIAENHFDNNDTIEIPYNKYCGLINEKMGGKQLIKKGKLDNWIRLATQEVIPSDFTDIPPDNTDSNTPPTITIGEPSLTEEEDKDVTSLVKNQLNQIYADSNIELNNKGLHEKIKSDIRFYKKNSDNNSDSIDSQIAYHDFHNLQIAFESIWAEAFDGKVKEDISKLYNYVVEVLEEYNDPNFTNSEINDIKAILDNEVVDYRDVLSKIGSVTRTLGEGIPIPYQVMSIGLPNIGDKWSKLSIQQQSIIIELVENINNPEIINIDSYHKFNKEEKKQALFEIVRNNLDSIAKTIINKNWNGRRGQTLYYIWSDLSDGNSGSMNNARNHFLNQVSQNKDFFSVDELYFSMNHGFDWKPWHGNHHERMYFNVKDYVFEKYGASKEKERDEILKILNNPQGISTRTENLIKQLNERLLEPYAFHVFAPDSVNYGILTTYRQEWRPENWQVGDLVSTIPLTPGEKRKFTKKLKVKKTRSQKEIEKSLYSRTDESNYISKAHTDIVQKAQSANNFNMTVNGNFGFSVGVFNGGGSTSTTFQNNQSVESAKTKKSIRESTIKAAHEYKNERNIEISTTDETDFEETTSGEISNPNNEITVTYLFYELERQFRITESLHKLTPVIMVAFDVPEPHEVDEDWLLTHEWILRRILLDDSFNEALDYIREGIVGDQINYEAAKAHYNNQKKIVEEISGNVESMSLLKASIQEQLNKTRERKNIVEFNNRRKSTFDAFTAFTGAVTGALPIIEGIKGEANGYDPEYYKAEMEAFENRLNLTKDELVAVQNELAREITALEKAKNQMMGLTEKVQTKRNLINQLRIHVKQNILYYMQGIWEMEPPDQRFFRLYDKVAPMVKPKDIILEKTSSQNTRSRYNMNFMTTDRTFGGDFVRTVYEVPEDIDETRKLHEVADLDNLMGFKGNYAIFPLKECTYLTDFMMKDYVNEFLGLADPDEHGNYKIEELRKAYKLLEKSGKFKELAEQIKELITAKLADPQMKDELVVVPTGQLFIEALPGKHALLEDFKLKHRAMDVLKVKEEVREAQIENLRKSARILDKEYNDPLNDKRINIYGKQSDLDINI
ncbi:hypothetical protein [uncultured Psychroserpens sp.]|uniref:hypothetical protein n=1 Tax=uncultured Psychroserpens sp. TaxID=255436 RepID=UPI0026378333|nr:hypothetical protein [uncultured Psychroserpens sp.]